MDPVGHLDRRRRDLGRRRGRCSEQARVERPIRLGLDRRMDADEATATPQVPLERGLLSVIQNVSGGIEEYDGAIAAQVVVSEFPRIGADIDVELVVMAKVLDRAGA